MPYLNGKEISIYEADEIADTEQQLINIKPHSGVIVCSCGRWLYPSMYKKGYCPFCNKEV